MDKTAIRAKWTMISPLLDERARRIWAAAESEALGWGGITLVSKVTGLSRQTIHSALKAAHGMPAGEYAEPSKAGRVRSEGAGRKSLSEGDPALVRDLELLVDPAPQGDPMSPLLWTSKSTEHLAAALRQLGHKVSWKTVGRMLKAKGFSLQANRNSNEGGIHPDREGQFAHINAQAVGFQEDEQPVISADTRKKNHAAPELAVQTIRIWWQQMGQPMYPDATRLLVTADCGGNNGHRAQAWKRSLQQLANETGLIISVCHFPPGTSKWSRIEQRMSCHITQHRRGLPPVRLEAVVSLIGAVATRQGPRIRTDRDPHQSEMGRKITGHDLAEVRSGRPEFPENWNYSLLPNDK